MAADLQTILPLDQSYDPAAYAQLQRQKMMSDLLMKQGYGDPLQGQMVGNVYVKPSWTQGLAKALQMYSANKMGTEADTKLAQIQAQAMRNVFGNAMGLGQSSAPQGGAVQGSYAAPDNTQIGDTGTQSVPMPSQGAPAQPVQQQPGMTGMIPGTNVPRSSALSAMLWNQIGNPEMAKAALAPYEPTDQQRNAGYAYGAGTPEAKAAIKAQVNKEGYIPPVSLRGQAYQTADGQLHTLPDQAQPGFINMPDPTSPTGWKQVENPGGLAAVSQSTRAQASGPASYRLEKVWNPQTKQYEMQPATNVAAAAGGAGSFPTVSPGDQTSRNADRLVILQQELQSHPNDPWLKDEIAKTQSAGQPGAAFSVTTGRSAMAAEPPLGTTANANVSQEAAAKAMQESFGSLQKSRAGGSAAVQDINHMLELGAAKSPLIAGPVATEIAKIFSPNAAVYEKSRDNLVTQLSGQLGMSTDSARDMVYGSIPSYGAPKDAIRDGLNNLKNQVQLRMMKADFMTPHFNSGDSSSYTSKENQFDQAMSPAVVPLLTMPGGPSRAQALKQAAADPKQRAALEWAAQNGILK